MTTHPSRLSVKAQPLPPNSVVWGKQGEGEALKRSQQLAWASAFRSQLQAFDYEITEIEGVLPEELKGSTLFRNGPSRFERGDQRVAHYLDGDGYIAKIAFAPDGRVTFFFSLCENGGVCLGGCGECVWVFGRRLGMRSQGDFWRVCWICI